MPRHLNERYCRKLTGECGVECFSPLEHREFNCAAINKMAHDLAAHRAKCNLCAKRRPHIGFNSSAGQGQIDNPAFILPAIIERQNRYRVTRRNTFMATVFRQIQFMTICKPGQLSSKFVFLAFRRENGHGKAVGQGAGKYTFHPADMIDVGNNLFTKSAGVVGYERAVAGRHVDNLARILRAILKHVTAVELDMHTLKIATF